MKLKDDLKFLQREDDLLFLDMEDNHNYFCKWKTTRKGGPPLPGRRVFPGDNIDSNRYSFRVFVGDNRHSK